MLDKQQQAAFREWLTFLIDQATAKAPTGTAKLVQSDYEPVLGFLKDVLAVAPKP